MNKLCKIKFIPFKRLRNLNSLIWIETSFELKQSSLPFSERFTVDYDHAIPCMSPSYSDKDSYEDLFEALVKEHDLTDIPFYETYAYTRDSLYARKEEEKLNKGIDLFKNIVFIPANITYYPETLESFYILCPP